MPEALLTNLFELLPLKIERGWARYCERLEIKEDRNKTRKADLYPVGLSSHSPTLLLLQQSCQILSRKETGKSYNLSKLC